MNKLEQARFDEGVREDFRQRIKAVKAALKEGIFSGEMPFDIPPSEWTEELLISTARKFVLAHLDSNAELN